MIISTYKDWNSKVYITHAISPDRGVGADYEGRKYVPLMPSLRSLRKWMENKDKLSVEDNDKRFTDDYYHEVLEKLDVDTVYKELEYSTLLTYEGRLETHIVAAWIHILLGIDVSFGKAEEYAIIKTKPREDVEKYLEEAMRKERNMRGFTSLRALYLFEKGEVFETKGYKLDEKGLDGSDYHQLACYYRCDADEAELQYSMKKRGNKTN